MTEHKTDMDAVIDLATNANLPTPAAINPDLIYTISLPAGTTYQVVDLEKHLDRPRRSRGRITLHDSDSLVGYIRDHDQGVHTAIYADLGGSTITAVLNDHARGTATASGWGDHRAEYPVRQSKEWQKWAAKNETWLSQADFAEHIEACSDDIVEPTAGEMLDLAQTLQANSKVAFKSQTILANGQRQFRYEETVEAHAGQQGTMKIPGRFSLGIRVYDGMGEAYKVTARLQFRLHDGTLKLRYLLDRPHDVLRAAFDDVVNAVEAGTELDAYRGAAPCPL